MSAVGETTIEPLVVPPVEKMSPLQLVAPPAPNQVSVLEPPDAIVSKSAVSDAVTACPTATVTKSDAMAPPSARQVMM